jgi:hypothetical protein
MWLPDRAGQHYASEFRLVAIAAKTGKLQT